MIELKKQIQICKKFLISLEKSLEIYDYAVNYFIIVKDKIIKKINNLENFTKNINELNYIDTENLEKTNIKIQREDN